MPQLSNLNEWKNALGLLPIKLTSHVGQNKFILLNGGTGDFCLQLNEQQESKEYYFSSSWSSNTKNFVTYDDNDIFLYNWKRKTKEKIAKASVEENFLRFYDYILTNSFTSESDITPFIVNIFRKIRNLTDDKLNGTDSLNLLFYLFASLEDAPDAITQDKWGVNQIDLPDGFENYVNEFKNGIDGIKPQLDLIIRHSAGTLFQEAQKEVILFDKQVELFTGTLSGHYKTRHQLYSSIHYTPSYLARTIVENALRKLDLTKPTLKILDPACGCSEFLMEVLKQLKSKNYKGTVNVIGWDSSESAINTSRFLLKYEAREWGDQLSVTLKLVPDSLLEQWDNDYDCILMNPPFVSWELMNNTARESVKTTLDFAFKGRPNQASAFFFKSIGCLAQDGVIGTVIPSSLLNSSGYEKSREYISSLITFSIVGKLGNFVFEDALTDVSIVIATKSIKGETPTLIWARNDKGIASEALRDLRKSQYSNVPSKITSDFSVYIPASYPVTPTNWNVISYQDNEFLQKVERYVLEGKLVRVDELFNVKQGIRSGSNDVFKFTQSELLSLIPDEERKFFKPAIDNEAIDRGLLTMGNYIWYPYNSAGLIIKTEGELKELAPTFFKLRLEPNMEMLKRRAKINEWWGLTWPRTWQFEKKTRLCSTEFGKSKSFAVDEKGEFVIERGHGWLPRKSFDKQDLFFYLAILSSTYFDKFLSIYSKEILSGWDLGNKYVKNIPIPSVLADGFKSSTAYEKLVYFGKCLSKGELRNPFPIDEILSSFIYPPILNVKWA